VGLSFRLFTLTNNLKDHLIPHDDNQRLARNCLLIGLLVAGAYGAGCVLHLAVGSMFMSA
jgi:hypothetical protein